MMNSMLADNLLALKKNNLADLKSVGLGGSCDMKYAINIIKTPNKYDGTFDFYILTDEDPKLVKPANTKIYKFNANGQYQSI